MDKFNEKSAGAVATAAKKVVKPKYDKVIEKYVETVFKDHKVPKGFEDAREKNHDLFMKTLETLKEPALAYLKKDKIY